MGSTLDKDDDAEAAADVDNVEAGEANEEYLRQTNEVCGSDEEEDSDAAAEVVDVDADEADEAYLREMEEAYE